MYTRIIFAQRMNTKLELLVFVNFTEETPPVWSEDSGF